MKNSMVLFLESLVLGLLYSFPFSAPYYWLTFVGFSLIIGAIHGVVFRGNIGKGLGVAIAVGALSGVWVTVFHLNTVPAGESVFFWFLIGVLMNAIMYTLRPSALLFYPFVWIGMKLWMWYTRKKQGIA